MVKGVIASGEGGGESEKEEERCFEIDVFGGKHVERILGAVDDGKDGWRIIPQIECSYLYIQLRSGVLT